MRNLLRRFQPLYRFFMPPAAVLNVVGFGLTTFLPGSIAAEPLPDGQPVPLTWQVTSRDYHSESWEATAQTIDPVTAKTRTERHSFVSIGSGMNYIDETGAFVPTVEAFQVTPDGNFAVAQFGPAKLIVENNINSPTALDILAYDGVRLRIAPLAVAWFDPLAQTNLTLATVRDCTGEMTANNEITFWNCFQGGAVRASIRVTYRKSGVSQDLLIHELSGPEALGLSRFSRLELYSELTPDTPVPVQNTRVVESADNNELLQLMPEAEPLLESFLDWGAYKMPPGFGAAAGQDQGRVRVYKRHLVTEDGRSILVESLPWSESSRYFAALATPKTNVMAKAIGTASEFRVPPVLRSSSAMEGRGSESVAQPSALVVGTTSKLDVRRSKFNVPVPS